MKDTIGYLPIPFLLLLRNVGRHRIKCSSAGIPSAPEQWHHRDVLQIACLATRLPHRVAATHPSVRPDTRQPIGYGWHDAATVLLDMPLRNVSHGHDAAIAIGDRRSEHTLAFEYPLAMVPQRPMAKVRKQLFRTIEPIVDDNYSPQPFRRSDARRTAHEILGES